LVKHGIVYREFKAPETITGQELLNRKLQVNEGYENQLRIEQKKYMVLENKLAKVKDLVNENRMNAIKQLVKEGKI
jgi:hypothetical protein